jgi:uncharacterized protein (DUF1810 family)
MLNPKTSIEAQFTDDPFNLSRFVQAQADTFETALAEIRAGLKRTHWMWFIFPQFTGLAFSPTSQHFAIKSVEEARAYLAHPTLGLRLLECAEATLDVEGRSAQEIFGSPDDLKLKSCATLFTEISPPNSVFERLLQKFYAGEPDQKTLALLRF